MVAPIVYPVILVLEELIPLAFGAAAVGIGATAIAKNPPPRPFWDSYESPTTLPLPIPVSGLDLNLDSIRPWQPPTILNMADESVPEAPPIGNIADTGTGTPSAPEPPQDPSRWRNALRRISDVQTFIRDRWYLRWAPVPLAMAYAAGHTALMASRQDSERQALRVPVPGEVYLKVQTGLFSPQEGIEIAQKYAYDQTLMLSLIPKQFESVFTPDGSLVLVHTLLETLSMHPAVDSKQKSLYFTAIEVAHKKVEDQFMQHTLVEMADAVGNPELVFSAGDKIIQGHIMNNGVRGIIQPMRAEKEALQSIVATHVAWMEKRGLPAEIISQIQARIPTVDERLPLEWGRIQAKISTTKTYIDSVRLSFATMRDDFVMKNLDVWELFESKAMPNDATNSPGSMVGMLGASMILKPSWTIVFRAIPFMMAGSLVHSANEVGDEAFRRLPIKFCLPGYGSLCDIL